MIDLAAERQRKAFARVRESIEAAQRTIVTSFDQVIASLEDLALVVAVSTPPPAGSVTPQFVNVERAAEILGVHKSTVWKWVESGEIEYVEFPSGRGDKPIKKFNVADLEAFGTRHKAVAS